MSGTTFEGNAMTHNEKLITIKAMQMYGGSFVKALAAAWLLADDDNAAKIEHAFPAYMAKYGPNSGMYAEAAKALRDD